MIDEDLIAYLTSNLASVYDTSAVGAIQLNSTDEVAPETYLWLQKSSVERDVLMDKTVSTQDYNFDCEIVSPSVSLASNIAQAIRDLIHGMQGLMGDSFIDEGEVEDAQDDYQRKADYRNRGLHVISLRLIFYTC